MVSLSLSFRVEVPIPFLKNRPGGMAPLEALFHRLDENGVGSCAPEADVLGGELSRTVYG